MHLREFDYGSMAGSGIWLVFMAVKALVVLALIALIVILIIKLIRRRPYPGQYPGQRPGPGPGPGPGQQPFGRDMAGDYRMHAGKALEILNERYAKGEIGDEEYIKKKAELIKN